MLVLSRFRVASPDQDAFLDDARDAVRVLSARPGCVTIRLARALDEEDLWVMVTEWESVGAYRRALGAYEVKLHAVPLMYRAVDEPSAYEVLLEHTADGIAAYESDRTADSLDRPERR